MGKINTVKILEECKIYPWQPSPNSTSDFSLSPSSFDIMFLQVPPIQRLFFYSLTDSNLPFLDSILPKLKQSLSFSLQHFLPLAGNLTFSPQTLKPIILYTLGDAVSLTVAETDADFNHFTGEHPLEVMESPFLSPVIQPSDTSVPVMAVQITYFPNNIGFSIGTALNHGVVDARSEVMFLKAWAFLSKLDKPRVPYSIVSLPAELTPIFDRNVIVNPYNIDFHGNSLKFSIDFSSLSNCVRAVFEITEADIKKLKNKVKNQELQLSKFVVTCAYVIVCLIKTEKLGADEKFFIPMLADMRGRSEPPIPMNYFGNCIGGGGVFVEAEEVTEDEDGFEKIAERIGNEIREINKEKHLESAIKKFIIDSVEAGKSGAKVITIGSSPKLKVYETDFGWGKPKKVDFVSIGSGGLAITDAKDGGEGLEFGIVLPRDRMDNFASLFSSGLKN